MAIMIKNPIISQVSLTVSDLSRSVDFYQNALGFSLQASEQSRATLGSSDYAFLELVENPQARQRSGTTGLYHFAVLVPSRLELARVLYHLAQSKTPLQGLSDHGVSEAIYLADPDGNGIEIYTDRHQDDWPFKNGQLEMLTLPLNTDELFSLLDSENEPWLGIAEDTVLGHVHLRVSHIPEAEQFYCELLGFDLVQRYGSSASFLSMDGYHHHVGMNTWAGVGAAPPPANSVGLREVKINLNGAAIIDRLQATNWPYEVLDSGLVLQDPSGNGIVIIGED